MLASLLTIALLHWIVLLVPGANFVLVGQLAAGHQRSVAVAASFGISTVTFMWATVAILGLGLLFTTQPHWRYVLQVAGGLYLCYLATRFWRVRSLASTTALTHVSVSQAFRQGFFTNVLNPKTALFFGSVFATALPAHASLSLLVTAVVLVYLNSLVWHLILAFLFSQRTIQQFYARKVHIFSRFCSILIAFFGLQLVIHTIIELL